MRPSPAVPAARPALARFAALISFASLAALACFASSAFADLYVSPTGSVEAPGTFEQPTTLERAITLVSPGETIHLRGGDYVFTTQITIARDSTGQPDARKNLFAYVPPGGAPELPRLDFSGQPYGTGNNPRGLQINGHHWHVRGLEVFGSADNGIFVAGNHNIVERCVTHSNRDSGLQISRHSSAATDISEWPSHNLILNCESYDNYDSPPGTGENADGFACKLTSGPGNVFRGCVAHHNIDDGWDLFTNDNGPIGPVVIDQCIAYANGSLTDGTANDAGDRNGFKLGGSGYSVPHVVTRSIAFSNGKNGFTWNSNPGPIRMFNNLAWDNAEGNYKFDQPAPIFLNNISLWTSGSGKNDRYGGNSGIATGPSNVFWFASGNPKSRNDQGLQVSAASFRSLALPPGGFRRHVDGALDLGDFARLIDGSPLVNAGTVPDAAHQPELTYSLNNYHEGAADIGPREIYLARLPVFVLAPESVTVFGGGTAVFTARAEGTEPLAYQWFHGEDALPGQTDTTLVLTDLDASRAGAYTLLATNTLGHTDSAAATLVVETPVAPTITAGPQSRTIPLGSPVTFSVVATGTAPLAYEWFHGATPLPAFTGPSLTLDAVTVADAGSYTVTVRNDSGHDTSAPALLTVDTTPVAPAITAAPTDLTLVAGTGGAFTVAATGTPPLTYQWRRRGAPLPGETSATLNFSPAQLVHASDYDVVVSNAAGSVTSPAVSLTVLAAAPTQLVADSFADASRGGQTLPASVAWWTSSGSSNFTAATGSATQIASSSRTVLGYFTGSPATPVTLAAGQTLALSATITWSGFDDSTAAGLSNFHVGLLRSVANPAATSGTGFTASGSPNTAARVTGDYGSSFPSSGVFARYEGYAAFAHARTAAVADPVAFRARTLTDNGLLASTAAYTALAADAPEPSLALAAGTPYRVTLTVSRTGPGIELAYALRRVSDDALMAVGGALDSAATFTAFDTFAFYFGKASATPTYNLTFTETTLSLTSSPALDLSTWRAGWSLGGADADDLADPDDDGLPNLLEYALGLAPTVRDASPATLPALRSATTPDPEAPLRFRFTRPSAVVGIDYTVETSADLVTWTPLAATPLLESSTAATETYVVEIPPAPSVFARLRVTPE